MIDYRQHTQVASAPSYAVGVTGAGNHWEVAPLENERGEPVAKARIVAAADEARRRVERDLHDGLQQRLVSLIMRARLAQASVRPDQPELKDELARVVDGSTEALENIREISRGIHPAVLSECGLGPAVKALARRSPVPVTLHLGVDGRLPGPLEVSGYYILSEALENVAKHARATIVDVWIERRAGAFDLTVQDNGVGGADGRGPGLTGLMDRVDALAGTMQLVSPPGRGTRLHARLPVIGLSVPGETSGVSRMQAPDAEAGSDGERNRSPRRPGAWPLVPARRKGDTQLALREVQQYGRDSFGDPDYVSVYGAARKPKSPG